MIWAFGQDLPIWICLLIDFVLGGISAVLYEFIFQRREGKIHVVESHEGKPDRYVFEFNVEPEIIKSRRFVSFKIIKENENSQFLQQL